jgi:hypothetical protein
MKTFKNPILETKYINVFGETIHMVMDKDKELYIYHNDCTEDFIKIKNFDFITNKTEQMVILNFIDTAYKLINNLEMSN